MSAQEIVPFVHEGLGNSSYLVRVADGAAILVDPDRTAGRYFDEGASRGWEIAAVFETHLHADFVSGGLEARSVTGATIHLPADAGAGFPHRGLVPGERIEVGDVEIEAVASPGHTPEHLSYVVRGDGAAPPLLFSGGALIAGGAARTDLIAPERTEELTRAEFRTLHEAFSDLPDETVLLPTHGGGSFCSVGARGRRASTLGQERATNPLLAYHDVERFLREWPRTFPAVPAYFSRMRGVNRAGPRLREDVEPPRPLLPEAFLREQADGALVVDVRSPAAYARGHVSGSIANPFRESFATWLGWLVELEVPLLFVVDGVRVEAVVDESLLVGFESFAGYLAGGVEAWVSAGQPLARIDLIGPVAAASAIDEGAIALDVREPDEFARGHIEGALHVPLGRLAEHVGDLPKDRPVVTYCGAGERSSSAASLLERAGVGPVLNLEGGFGAWKEGGPAAV